MAKQMVFDRDAFDNAVQYDGHVRAWKRVLSGRERKKRWNLAHGGARPRRARMDPDVRRERSRAWCKKWEARNRENVRERKRQKRMANLEAVRAGERLRYRQNIDSIRPKKEAWRRNNIDVLRNSHLKRKFGITVQRKREMLEQQGYRCSVCQCALLDLTAAQVDHCHKTKAIRSLLCKKCNIAIGLLRDDPEICARAAEYLKKHAMEAA